MNTAKLKNILKHTSECKFKLTWLHRRLHRLHKFGSPMYFYNKTNSWGKWLGIISIALISISFICGLFLVPQDYQQQDAFRIIYVHVPAALLSMAVYTYIAICSLIYLVWRIKIVDILAAKSASIGASFTLLALVSGAIWGKPMWGTFWVWDARLTSELLLLFIYLGYIGLRNALSHDLRFQALAASILGIVGAINIPIIHYSVEWWHTLHQGPSISRFSKPAIATEMLIPLLIAIVGFFVFYLFIIIMNARQEVLWRERNSSWVQELILAKMRSTK